MNAIITLPALRLSVSVPGNTPTETLQNALNAVKVSLGLFEATPAPEVLGIALCGVAWHHHHVTARVLPSPSPIVRYGRLITSHLVVLSLEGTPTISVSTVILDEEDMSVAQLFEGSFVCADVLRDVPSFVRALT